MDEIRIEGLKIYAYHGVYAQENETGQDFYVNAVLYTDTREAGRQDALALSTDYGEVCHFINDFLKLHTFKLIETMAEKTAEQILLRFPLIRALDLEIRKPQAPIGLPFSCVSVKLHRGWHRTYVAVGSNMGDKYAYIEEALQDMRENKNIRNFRASGLIETKPYGEVKEQEDFVNGVVEFDTLFTPEELLELLHDLEQKAGRERKIHWGPRTLDLDIVFYDDLILDTESLTIPHSDMHNRSFVLEPLCELAPCKRHPLLHKTVAELLQDIK